MKQVKSYSSSYVCYGWEVDVLPTCLLITSDKQVTANAPQNAYRKQSCADEDYSSAFRVGSVDMVQANECKEQAREAGNFERE
jgi:hypothetical protein